MNQKPTIHSVEDLCKYIWSLEERLQLLDMEIQGVKVWQAQRMATYYRIAEELGLFGSPHTAPQRRHFISNLYTMARNVFLQNPFLLRPAKNLVIPHARTKQVDGEDIDIYSFYLVEELLAEGQTVNVLEPHYLGQHKASPSSSKKYADFIFAIAELGRKFFPAKLSAEDFHRLQRIDDILLDELGVKIGFAAGCRAYIANFRVRHFFYRLLLKKTNPSSLWIVNAYAHPPLLKAAKGLNIPVTEIQHGTFSEYHLGYSFPGREAALEYFPDYFYVWTAFWKDMMTFPVHNDKVMVKPFAYFERQRIRYQDVVVVQGQIIILSQGVLGDALAECVLDNFHYFSTMEIRYKLHPGEYDRWKSYPHLVQLASHDNVSILTDCDLYQQFAESEYVAGVFSTAIYEAVDFKCIPVIFDLPGIEYMDKFIAYHGLKKQGPCYWPGDDSRFPVEAS